METYTLAHSTDTYQSTILSNPTEHYGNTAGTSCSQHADHMARSSQNVGRPYINMVPPSHRNGLQPIEECRFSSNASEYSLTQPLARRALVPSESTPIPTCSSVSGLSDPIESRNGTSTQNLLNGNGTGSANSTQGSYVNVTACALSTNRTGTAVSNSSAGSHTVQYINLASASMRSCSTDSPSGHCVSLTITTPVQSICQCYRTEPTTNHVALSSTSHSPRKCSGEQSPCHIRSTCSTSVCLHQSNMAQTFATDQCNKECVPAVLPTSKPGVLSNNVPRLHYAHLTLSNDSTCRMLRPSSSATSNRESSSDLRPNIHTVQSLPCAFVGTTGATGTVMSTSHSGDIATTTSVSTTCSGLNYVTIDLVQTKALSELERELRGATESESGSHSLLNTGSRRATISRAGTHSATLPGPSTTVDVSLNNFSAHISTLCDNNITFRFLFS
ncbi:unnamed protein product [Echinostoma caproni]|uniref:Uncharacterized protein n=1 Tax=Echinostoma caproni TaxID=27848 RepID=A0A3P8G3X8_9TREM|nr:unnamed protein product [Echinostoma caproni]